MQVNASTSATLPLASKPSSKSISTPDNHQFTSITLGTEFVPLDPERAHQVRLFFAESATGLKGEEALEKYKKTMERTMKLLEGGGHPDPAVLEKQLQKQADSIFRSPAGEVLAVVYKDGTVHTQGEGMRIDFDALFKSAKGLSEHEYRAAIRNGIAAALGSRAVASYYDYHQPAPTMREINEEERIFYSRA